MKRMGKKGVFSRTMTWLICIVISMASILIILVTSCEIAIYGDMDYYQVLYERYEVVDDLNMEMEDVLAVTEEMMLFLRGDREDLIVDTVVGGVEQEFFNESEISHMVDVQGLFIAGLQVRMISIGIVVGFLVLLVILRTNWKYILPRAFQGVTALFLLVVGVLGYLFATDFYKYFVIFHGIFFEDGTWTFDTRTSLMINMLPEGLFYDFTLRIVVVFLVIMGTLLVGASVVRRKSKRE